MIKNTPVVWYSCRSNNQMSYLHSYSTKRSTENWDISKIGATRIITARISDIGCYYYNGIGEDNNVSSSVGEWSYSYNYVSSIGDYIC